MTTKMQLLNYMTINLYFYLTMLNSGKPKKGFNV